MLFTVIFFIEAAKKEELHIMISYQWDHQKIFIDVRDALLKAGHKVWMDIDQMGGSTLEAMANAVEGAKFILMSVSKKYKDSTSCRSGIVLIISGAILKIYIAYYLLCTYYTYIYIYMYT